LNVSSYKSSYGIENRGLVKFGYVLRRGVVHNQGKKEGAFGDDLSPEAPVGIYHPLTKSEEIQ
jgi:hypothetical protein